MDLKRKLLEKLDDGKFIAALLLIFALALSEAAPHIAPEVRIYTVSEPATLSVSGNVSAGIISGAWNNPPLAGWPPNVVATTLAVPFAAIRDMGKSRPGSK